MERVRSPDGTEIAVDRVGGDQRSAASGPRTLVCIHGTGASRDQWAAFADRLGGVECVVYDRRGRGDSGDTDEYSLAREVDDARAVVEHVGDPSSVAVFGHSFGGVVAFELARDVGLDRSDVGLDRLVLYEPPVLAGDHAGRETGFADHLRELHEASGAPAVYREFYGVADGEEGVDVREWTGVPPAHTFVREAGVVQAYDVPDSVGVSTPALLCYGSESGEFLQDSTRAVADALPETEFVTFEGYGHVAMAEAPGLVANEVDRFLGE